MTGETRRNKWHRNGPYVTVLKPKERIWLLWLSIAIAIIVALVLKHQTHEGCFVKMRVKLDTIASIDSHAFIAASWQLPKIIFIPSFLVMEMAIQ